MSPPVPPLLLLATLGLCVAFIVVYVARQESARRCKQEKQPPLTDVLHSPTFDKLHTVAHVVCVLTQVTAFLAYIWMLSSTGDALGTELTGAVSVTAVLLLARSAMFLATTLPDASGTCTGSAAPWTTHGGCGDLMFSGHTAIITAAFLRAGVGGGWACFGGALYGIGACILRRHYTIDVIVGIGAAFAAQALVGGVTHLG
jgi:hypothetical protein